MNFAVGGSVVDNTVVEPFMLGSNLREETDIFLDAFTGNKSRLAWKSETSVFVFWFGVNDVHGSNGMKDIPEVFARIFETYTANVDRVRYPAILKFNTLAAFPSHIQENTRWSGS